LFVITSFLPIVNAPLIEIDSRQTLGDRTRKKRTE
jgi:hypothetical protein